MAVICFLFLVFVCAEEVVVSPTLQDENPSFLSEKSNHQKIDTIGIEKRTYERALLKIPSSECQLKKYPEVKRFAEETAPRFPHLEVAKYAQPPHFFFYYGPRQKERVDIGGMTYEEILEQVLQRDFQEVIILNIYPWFHLIFPSFLLTNSIF